MRYLMWFALPCCGAMLLGCLVLSWWLALLLTLLLGAMTVVLARSRVGCRVLLGLLTAGACLGCCWFGIHQILVVLPARALDGVSSGFTAQVTEYPTETDYGVSVKLRMKSGAAQGRRVQVYLDGWYGNLKPGDQLTGTGKFAAVLGETGGGAAASRGTFLQADIEVAQVQRGRTVPARFLPTWLGAQLKQLVSRLYDGPEGALLQGLLTGDESRMSDQLYTSFRRAGLAHLLAVSGLHVGFLTGMIYLLPGRKKHRIFLAVPLMVCFALMTGGQSSVWRAVVMGSLLLAAPLFGRETDPLTSLSVALLLLLLPNPYAILNVGLQLSFAAVAGLACFGGKLYHWMTRPLGDDGDHGRRRTTWRRRAVEKLWRWIAAGLATSCCATLFTLPLSGWYFDSISLIGPLSNLLAVWAASLAFGLGLVSCGVYAVCPPLAQLLAWPVRLLLDWLMAVAQSLGRQTYAAVTLDSFYLKLWLVFLLTAVLLTAACSGLRHRPLLPICSTLALLVLALSLRMLSLSSLPLCVSVLDVGEGSCTVFSSQGSYVAVDCGGYRAGDALADYLQSGGVSRLALLALTHYDSDHVNGVEELLNRIRVDTLVLPDVEDETGTRQALEQLAEAQGSYIRWISEDTMTVGFGSAELKLYPPVGTGEDNASCVSALCSWQGHSVLITGDLEREQEELLLEREELPKLDLLVVGHHGSDTSTGARLLAELSPEIAVISVGRNGYGFPAPEVLDRLADYRCKLFRTDQNGTVTLRCR